MGEHRIKNQKLTVWVAPEMWVQMSEMAKRMGLTRSEFVRQAITFYMLFASKKERR